MNFRSYLFLLIIIGMSGCKRKPTSANALFTLLAPAQTHITFSNKLTEGLNTNVLMYEYFYNDGSVAVGDLNGDGLNDIYFTGNMTDNKLYIDKAHMHFTDVTAIAGAARLGHGSKTETNRQESVNAIKKQII